ncbi:RelA/SpoT domain-containing protein [Vibrio splendidus]
MANEQYKDQKKPLKFSKKKINNAARDIRHGAQNHERLEAIDKIQNFREFHLYPLMLMKNHLVRTAKRVSPKVVVARRLKRLPTIIDKLERPTLDGQNQNAIKLTRMQDIAGCRAIVKDKTELALLRDKLERSRCVHRIVRTKDYLSSPKSSGYGGLHLIYSCYEGQDEQHDWKGASVEVQLRTKLQHSWATSLEIIDTLEGINLKTSVSGHDKWRRFFEVSGQLVAHKEDLHRLENSEYFNLLAELNSLSHELDPIGKLSRYSLAINISSMSSIPQSKRSGKGLFLISMPLHKGDDEQEEYSVTVDFFPRNESDQAIEGLNKAELNPDILMCVLVSAEGVRNLKQAYPNYFGSTKLFSGFLTSQTQAYNKYLKLKVKLAIQMVEEKKASGEELPQKLVEHIEQVKGLIG